MTSIRFEQIINNFKYRSPRNEQTGDIEKTIHNAAKQAALYYAKVCPESRELDNAITALEQAVMWANAAIARQEKPK